MNANTTEGKTIGVETDKKYVPFTIVCPEIKPGQGVKTREISIAVRVKHGGEIITPESMDRIDAIKSQMMLTRLTECVQELYSLIGESSPPNLK